MPDARRPHAVATPFAAQLCIRTTEIYLRMDPSEKLEAVEAVIPPALRRGRFKAPDALIASLLEKVPLSSG